MNSLTGKTALITGAGRGIGRAFALALAKEGVTVAVNYVSDEDSARALCAQIEATGGTCLLAKADLTQEDCAKKLASLLPSADILILNASIQIRKRWTDITAEEFERQIACNLRASLLLMQQYAPGMAASGWGRIITIGSVQEKKPHPDMLVYAASKAALTAMAGSLAVQLAPSGVTVNSIAPGVILTDRNMEALADPDYRDATINGIPSGFLGASEDCVGALLLLCGESGRYITGQNIFVDGGMGS